MVVEIEPLDFKFIDNWCNSFPHVEIASFSMKTGVNYNRNDVQRTWMYIERKLKLMKYESKT